MFRSLCFVLMLSLSLVTTQLPAIAGSVESNHAVYRVTSERLDLTLPGATGDARELAQVARWSFRIGALLGPAAILDVTDGEVALCWGEQSERYGCIQSLDPWRDGRLSTLFERVASLVDASPEDRRFAWRSVAQVAPAHRTVADRNGAVNEASRCDSDHSLVVTLSVRDGARVHRQHWCRIAHPVGTQASARESSELPGC